MAAATSELVVLEPVADGRLYPVQSGANTYFVDPETGECDCPFWVHRCCSNWQLCKHGRAVKAHIEAALACPVCRGRGLLVPCGLISYVSRTGDPDMDGLPCIRCDGTGKR